MSDVGRAHGGRIITSAEYLRVETSYVLALRSFLEASHLNALRIADLQLNEIRPENFPSELADETLAHAGTVADDTEVSGGDLDWIVRLALREALWCRLKGAQGFYVHFGYDYYMYVGSEGLGPVPPQLPSGIFAEVFDSPHHEEPPDEKDG